MKSKQKDDDRRNCYRAPVKTKVYLNDEESEGLIYFYTENLSIGGVFLMRYSVVFIGFDIPLS